MGATVINFSNDNTFSADNTSSLSGTAGTTTSLTDGTSLKVGVSAGKFWDTSVTGSWNNADAITEMNRTLGTSFDTDLSSVLKFAATGANGSHSTLTFSFADNSSINAGDEVVFYFLVSSTVSNYSSFSVSGLEGHTVQWASADGAGYQTDATNASATRLSLIKVTGTVSSSENVAFTSSVAKNGWSMAAYTAVGAVPEPATATLSLLGLGGALTLRRRRA